jgi:hypothetical protein
LRLERVLEELETIGSCSAEAEFEPQAWRPEPELSLLMMSAA